MSTDTEYQELDLRKLSQADQYEELAVWVQFHCSSLFRANKREIMRIDYEPAVVYYDEQGRQTFHLTGKQLSPLITNAAVIELMERFKRGWKNERSSHQTNPRVYHVIVISDDGKEHVGSAPNFPIAACIAALRASGVQVIL